MAKYLFVFISGKLEREEEIGWENWGNEKSTEEFRTRADNSIMRMCIFN